MGGAVNEVRGSGKLGPKATGKKGVGPHKLTSQQLPLTYSAPRQLAVNQHAPGRKTEIFSGREKRSKILTSESLPGIKLRS